MHVSHIETTLYRIPLPVPIQAASTAVMRGFDMVMLTSDLACMTAGVRQQLDAFKAKTA